MNTVELLVSVASVEVRESFTLLKVTSLVASRDGVEWFKPTEVVKGVSSMVTSLVVDNEYYTKIVGQTPIFNGQILSVLCEEHIAGVTEYLDKENNKCVHYSKAVEECRMNLGDTRLSPTYLFEGDVRIFDAEGIKQQVLDRVLDKYEEGYKRFKLAQM